MNPYPITIQCTVYAPYKKVWECWTTPADIMQWNNASPDWHTPRAQNDLRVGGRFLYHMAARDGSFAFDFEGIYDTIILHQEISYTMPDGRKVTVRFQSVDHATLVTETFDPEQQNSIDLQRTGWQAILDNFKRYVESKQQG